MSLYLQEQKVDNAMLCAFDFIRVGTNREVDIEYIEQKLDKQLKLYPGTHLFITQGSICKNAFGETDYLKQGGSDYTAKYGSPYWCGLACKRDKAMDKLCNTQQRHVGHKGR